MAKPKPPTPNTRDKTEDWMKSLGVKFCDVWFYTSRRTWKHEPQVKDDDTFLEAISMAFVRLLATHALWFDGEMWCLLIRVSGDTKRYPSREAAEMVAIHRAR